MVSVAAGPSVTNRGGPARPAILAALRDLLDEQPFHEILVMTIAERAHISRPGFYFHFDSKLAALAALQQERTAPVRRLAMRIRRRTPEEPETALVERIVEGICRLLAAGDPVSSACRACRYADAGIDDAVSAAENAVIGAVTAMIVGEVRRGARPISSDLPALIRNLTVATIGIGCGEDDFIGCSGSTARSLEVIKTMWLHALWPHLAHPNHLGPWPPSAISKGLS